MPTNPRISSLSTLHYLAPLILLVVGVVVFVRGFQAPFLFDDIGSIDPGINPYYRAIGDNPPVKAFRDHLYAGQVGAIFQSMAQVPAAKWLETPRSILASLGTALHVPDGQTVTGRPIVSFSLAVSYALSGENMWGYHLLNVLMHLGNALLLYGIIRRTLLRPVLAERFGAAAVPLALSVALIWLVHPLHANSVTYIITRTELLVSLFFLLTFYCAIRAWEAQGGGWGWMALAVVFCIIGMATKENMVVLPVLLWLYDRTFYSQRYWPAWGLGLGALVPLGVLLAAFPAAVAKLLPLPPELVLALQPIGVSMVVLAAAAAVVFAIFLPGAARPKDAQVRRNFVLFFLVAGSWTMLACLSASQDRPATGYKFGVTWFEYLRTQAGVILFYFRLALFPSKLSIYHQINITRFWYEWAPQGVVILGLLGLVGWALVCRPVLGFLGAWFFIILSPTSSFIPVITETGAERRMYLPLVSLILLVMLGGYRLLQWIMRRQGIAGTWEQRTIFILPVALVTAAFGLVSFIHIGVYRNSEMVWRDVVAKYPDCAFGWNNLGVSLAPTDPYGAIEACKNAVIANPSNAEAWGNLEVLLAGLSGSREMHIAYAGDVYQQIALSGNQSDNKNLAFFAYYRLGDYLANKMEDFDGAERYYGKALQIMPDHPRVYNSLGVVYYRQALRAPKPDLAQSLRQQAEATFEKARQAGNKKDDKDAQAVAYSNLAWLALDLVDQDVALNDTNAAKQHLISAQRHCASAEELQSQSPEVLVQLGDVLTRLGKRDPAALNQAIGYLEQAARKPTIMPANAQPAFEKLARAYLVRGDLDQAYDRAGRALKMRLDSIEARLLMVEVLLARGDSLSAQHRNTDADNEYRNAVGLAGDTVNHWPNLPVPHFWLARALLRARQLPEAKQQIDQVQSVVNGPDIQATADAIKKALQEAGQLPPTKP